MEERLSRTFKEKFRDLVTVIVAKQDIPRGTTIEDNLLTSSILPAKFVEPQAVTNANRIAGMKAAIRISEGEQLTLNKLVTPREAKERSLALATPVGKRAITISVDNIAGLAGMIEPGDYVDVIGLLPVPTQSPETGPSMQVATVPLFQKVLVLAVGRQLLEEQEEEKKTFFSFGQDKSKKQQKSSPLITIALSPKEASLLTFVNEQGRIQLTLRSPADAKTEPIPPANWNTLFQHIDSTFSQQQQPRRIRERMIKEPEQVEIYRGLERGNIEITQ
jgi:pilus assembly protein CpaB